MADDLSPRDDGHEAECSEWWLDTLALTAVWAVCPVVGVALCPGKIPGKLISDLQTQCSSDLP